ncbi:hypothetical protein [Sphingopyxis indica]|nr:hypothetical protein [Sphingopyxis indica]
MALVQQSARSEVDGMEYWLNVAGLSSGFIGSVLIFFFGVPRQVDNEGATFIITDAVNLNERHRISRYRLLGNLGLGMLAFAFALQLIATTL